MTPFLIFILSVPHIRFLFVPVIGLEPTRFWHMLLRHTWLPLHHTGELKRASRGIRTPESFQILSTNQVQSTTMRHWLFFGGSSPPIITLIRFLVRSDVGSTMTAYFRSQHQQMPYWISVMVINQSIYFLIQRTPQRYIIFFNFPNFEIKF